MRQNLLDLISEIPPFENKCFDSALQFFYYLLFTPKSVIMRKSIFTPFLLIACLFFFQYSDAQVSSYNFSQSSGTYTEITGGTVVATATGTTGIPSIDDVIFNLPAGTIPFDFNFNGTVYTGLNISSNGFITFGATAPATTTYTSISATLAYNGAVAAVSRDIQGVYATTANRTLNDPVLTNVAGFAGVEVGKVITGTGIAVGATIVSFDQGAGTITMSANATSTGAAGTVAIASGEIRYEVLGTAPNRVFVIQYKNFRKFAALTDNFNFQIRLHETTYAIETIYGNFISNATNAAPQVGLRGATNADFNNRTSTTDWSATTPGIANTASITLTTTVFPPGGLTFSWAIAPNLVAAGSSIVSEGCVPANNAVDPGETVTLSFCIQNTGLAGTTNVVGTLLSTGGVTTPSGPQNYGALGPLSSPVCRDFTFTANGTCGVTITVSIQLQDGTTNLGTVTYQITLGVASGVATVFSENFDGVAAPALPAGWTATNATGPAPLWETSSSGVLTPFAVSLPNSIFVDDPSVVSDKQIVTPIITIPPTGGAQISFQRNNNLETNWDGGVLEISINGGPYQDIIAAGGSFVTGGYNATLNASANPLASRQAWTGNSVGFVTTTANLPASANGQNVTFRFRMGSDGSVAGVGWRIDDVVVTAPLYTCCTPCIITCPANITVPTDPGQCGAIVNYSAPTTSGTCGPVTLSHPSGSFFPRGTTIVTASEPNGGSCFFTITVVDNELPVITCPSNITVNNAPGQCGANVSFTVTATDNCQGVTVISTPASGSFFPVGTTTVTSRATDASGNTSTCSFTVTVNDTQPPTITCPANITVNNTPGQCTGIATFPVPATSDNCGSGAVSNFFNTWSQTGQRGVFFDVVNISTIPITITALNPAMWATASLNETFTVYFTTSASTWNGNQANPSAWTQNTATPVSFPGGANPVQVSVPLTTPVVLNPGQSRGVYVVGNTGFGGGPVAYLSTSGLPAYTGPQSYDDGTLRFIGGIGSGGLFATFFGTGSSTDFRLYYGSVTYASPVPTVQIAGLPSGSAFPVGVTTNIFQATDAVGNTSTCSFTVTVVDNQPPAITCPANITTSTPIGSCTAVVNYTVTATDNCPGVTTALVSGPASGSVFPLGVTTVTWRATDAAGNTSTCQFTVTVNDGQIPVISQQPAPNPEFCIGSTGIISVTAAPLGGPNNLTYQWQVWNGTAFVNIAGATQPSLSIPNISAAMAGNTYRVIVMGLCTNVTSAQSTIRVKPVPAITLSTSMSPSLTPGQLLTITASVSPTGGTIAWYKDGVLIPGAVTLSLNNLTVDDVGVYHAVYTALNGCSATSGDVVVTKASSANVFIYPNPNDGRFQVRVYNQNEPVTVTVYDSRGSMVYQRTTTTSVPYTRIDVELSHAASGQYVVDVRGAGGSKLGAKQIVIWR
jgi:hypothetical protein